MRRLLVWGGGHAPAKAATGGGCPAFEPDSRRTPSWIPVVDQIRTAGPQMLDRRRRVWLADGAVPPPLTGSCAGFIRVPQGRRAASPPAPRQPRQAAITSSSARVFCAPSSTARANRSPPWRIGRCQSPYSTIAFTAAHLLPGALPCVSPRRNSSTIRSLTCSRPLRVRSVSRVLGAGRVELVEHLLQLPLRAALGRELVADGPELRVVVDRQVEHPARLVDAAADLLGVADREPLPRPLQPPVQRVHADHPDRRRRRDHRGRPVVAVHQQHVRPDRVAADLDVLRQRREHPHPAAAVQAAGGLEVQARARAAGRRTANASWFWTIR